jgi:hypothetical protein
MAKASKKSTSRDHGRSGQSAPLGNGFTRDDYIFAAVMKSEKYRNAYKQLLTDSAVSSSEPVGLVTLEYLWIMRAFKEGTSAPKPAVAAAREIGELARAPAASIDRLSANISQAIVEVWSHYERLTQQSKAPAKKPGWRKQSLIDLRRANRLSPDLLKCLKSFHQSPAIVFIKGFDGLLDNDDKDNDDDTGEHEGILRSTGKALVRFAELSARIISYLQKRKKRLRPTWAFDDRLAQSHRRNRRRAPHSPRYDCRRAPLVSPMARAKGH